MFVRSSARTRIMAWVLLLILAALAIVTFVTWRLLVQAVDQRMDAALESEVAEFDELTLAGVNRTTGQPFPSVEEMISDAIVYRAARPNEYFLGYVDGKFYNQCECTAEERATGHDATIIALADDQAFAALVGSVTEPTVGSFRQSALGEIRYRAVPVRLAGDPSTGVIVAAFLADAERASADAVARLMLGVGAGTLLLATAGAWLAAGRILRPLHDVAETARGITDSDLSQRIPSRTDSGRGDDLQDLIHTVNSMLDRVESGVSAQRRFIDDAGHELRTPITIVRGHLELLDPNDPADIRDTLALVDDELERMNRMVSDLLLLARSEQPTFVAPRPVDVDLLTHDILDHVIHLGDREFSLDAAAEVTCDLDPQRITQAMVALCDNACHYSAPGDRISIGSQLADGWLRFWVADTGPGISAQDQARIFERFSRGSAGSRRSEGAGLGLSIVSAIAAAHGGRVELDSTPGHGARFTIVIPADTPAPIVTPEGESWHES